MKKIAAAPGFLASRDKTRWRDADADMKKPAP